MLVHILGRMQRVELHYSIAAFENYSIFYLIVCIFPPIESINSILRGSVLCTHSDLLTRRKYVALVEAARDKGAKVFVFSR